MEEQEGTRCPHFQVYAERLDIEPGPNVLAIRRCMLTERMIGLLGQTPHGPMLTQKLTVRIDSAKDFAIVGPDLEAVSQSLCTNSRCTHNCTPAYSALLEHFGASDPDMDEVTCHEDAEEHAAPNRS